MGLGGQAFGRESGYSMAALLVTLAVMSVLMSVAMPVWRHQARREKEAELIFRGEQYARAVALYRSKPGNNNAFPPSIDVLVQGKYLRKKYKDPMTKDGEFQPNFVAAQTQPQPGQPQPGQPQPPQSGQQGGGIMGVRSKSQETSIRSYRGQTRYDQWAFNFNTVPRPGGATAPGGDAANPGGRGPRGAGPRGGGPGTNPTNRGNTPGDRGLFPPQPPPPRPVGPGGSRGFNPVGRGGGS
jgi:type II secretory pathway pseudopilin PulG